MTGKAGPSKLSKRDRLRRVIILCSSFIRNLAYYRAGQAQEVSSLLDENSQNVSFWRQANSNYIDICVLEWCKLFVEANGRHNWRRVISDQTGFEAGLLSHLGINADAFKNQREETRHYRNKFVAHLDEGSTMNIPRLDIALESVRYLHGHLISKETMPGDLAGLPDTLDKLDLGYKQCFDEALALFRQQLK